MVHATCYCETGLMIDIEDPRFVAWYGRTLPTLADERAELERRERAASHDPTLPIDEPDPIIRSYREAIRRIAVLGFTAVQGFALACAVEGADVAAHLRSDVIKARLSAATGKPRSRRVHEISALEAEEWTVFTVTDDLDSRRIKAWVIRQTPYVEVREGPFVGQFENVELHRVWRGGALPEGDDDELFARWWAQAVLERGLRRQRLERMAAIYARYRLVLRQALRPPPVLPQD